MVVFTVTIQAVMRSVRPDNPPRLMGASWPRLPQVAYDTCTGLISCLAAMSRKTAIPGNNHSLSPVY